MGNARYGLLQTDNRSSSGVFHWGKSCSELKDLFGLLQDGVIPAAIFSCKNGDD